MSVLSETVKELIENDYSSATPSQFLIKYMIINNFLLKTHGANKVSLLL